MCKEHNGKGACGKQEGESCDFCLKNDYTCTVDGEQVATTTNQPARGVASTGPTVKAKKAREAKNALAKNAQATRAKTITPSKAPLESGASTPALGGHAQNVATPPTAAGPSVLPRAATAVTEPAKPAKKKKKEDSVRVTTGAEHMHLIGLGSHAEQIGRWTEKYKAVSKTGTGTPQASKTAAAARTGGPLAIPVGGSTTSYGASTAFGVSGTASGGPAAFPLPPTTSIAPGLSTQAATTRANQAVVQAGASGTQRTMWTSHATASSSCATIVDPSRGLQAGVTLPQASAPRAIHALPSRPPQNAVTGYPPYHPSGAYVQHPGWYVPHPAYQQAYGAPGWPTHGSLQESEAPWRDMSQRAPPNMGAAPHAQIRGQGTSEDPCVIEDDE